MEGKAEGCPFGESGPAPALPLMLCRAEGMSMHFACLQLQPAEANKGKNLMAFKTSPLSVFFLSVEMEIARGSQTQQPNKACCNSALGCWVW